ncbi:MAG: GvpL/GvpF family gas vesicle protein [Mycobacteriales bacterium]
MTDRPVPPERLGTWMYAAAGTDTVAAGPLAGVTGVAGEPVRVIEEAGLVAAVGDVDLADFGAEALRRHLEDLDWLAARTRAHHAVVTAVAARGPVLPLRFASVYLGEDRVRALLAGRRDDLRAALRRVVGRSEWGVKAYAAGSPAGAPAGTGEPAAESRPGTAYLRRRQADLAAREEARRAATDQAERVDDALRRLAVAGRRHPPQDARLSGKPHRMVLNSSYLVDDGRADEFTATVGSLAGRHPGVQLELTGPWPPYSFADVPGAS